MRKALGAHQPLRAALLAVIPDDDAAFEVHAAAHHARAAGYALARHGLNAADRAIRRQDFHGFPLADGQIFSGEKHGKHILMVAALIRLRAQAVNGRALAAVEHAALQKRTVDAKAHLSAEGVHLAHQMALAGAPDGGVARHKRHAAQIQREHKRVYAHAGGGEGRLAARVPRADNNEIKMHRMPPGMPQGRRSICNPCRIHEIGTFCKGNSLVAGLFLRIFCGCTKNRPTRRQT